jgi:MFS family permease
VAEPLGSRFAKLWTASTTSALGSGLATIAAPLFVAAHTKNPLIVSVTTGVSWLPWLLFALPGGVLVDRVDRRRLMITIDWLRVAVMGVLATALLAGWSSIALLDAALFLINTGEIVFRSASQAMIPAVVPRARLERANGWLVGGTTLTQNMIAGPLGGFLFVLAACVPFYVNAGTYAASAVLVGLLAGTYRAVRPVAGGDDQARPVRRVRRELAEGFRWLAGQRVLRTMTVLIGLLNLTLTAAVAVLVLLVKERLHLGPVGYGTLFACMAVGALAGSASGDWLIKRVTATWTIRIGLLVEAGLHLVLATSRSAYLVGFMLFAFGVHGALWTIVGSSLRQRLTPPEMMGRVASTGLFIAAGGNCVGAVLGGVIAARFGITAPYWVGFVVAVLVSASTWRVFNRAAVAQAYAAPAWSATPQPGRGQRPAAGLRCGYRWEAPVRPEPGAQAASAGLRASRADRERVIDLLKAAFVQGRLARDEFDARIGQVLASRTYAELAVATADIPADVPAALLEAPPPRLPARKRCRVSMNTAVTAGAGVILVANVGMLAALFIGSPVAVVLIAVFTVIGAILTIAAMIVAP